MPGPVRLIYISKQKAQSVPDDHLFRHVLRVGKDLTGWAILRHDFRQPVQEIPCLVCHDGHRHQLDPFLFTVKEACGEL